AQPALRIALQDNAIEVRAYSALALVLGKFLDGAVISTIREALESDSLTIQDSAIEALAFIGSSSPATASLAFNASQLASRLAARCHAESTNDQEINRSCKKIVVTLQAMGPAGLSALSASFASLRENRTTVAKHWLERDSSGKSVVALMRGVGKL